MIEIVDVDLRLSSDRLSNMVFSRFSATLPGNERLVVLGRDGVGKTALIRLIAGLVLPTEGRVYRRCRVSFPVGFTGGLQRTISALENIRHAARLYGTDIDGAVAFAAGLTGFTSEMFVAVEDLPAQSRTRLSFAIAYSIAFDTYLIDDRISAGDPEFRAACEEIFWLRMRTSGCIIATKLPSVAKRYATKVALLERNSIRIYENVEQALVAFKALENRLGA